jgi:hypothetical protein
VYSLNALTIHSRSSLYTIYFFVAVVLSRWFIVTSYIIFAPTLSQIIIASRASLVLIWPQTIVTHPCLLTIPLSSCCSNVLHVLLLRKNLQRRIPLLLNIGFRQWDTLFHNIRFVCSTTNETKLNPCYLTADWCRFFNHLRSLNIPHFKVAEAMRLKKLWRWGHLQWRDRPEFHENLRTDSEVIIGGHTERQRDW